MIVSEGQSLIACAFRVSASLGVARAPLRFPACSFNGRRTRQDQTVEPAILKNNAAVQDTVVHRCGRYLAVDAESAGAVS